MATAFLMTEKALDDMIVQIADTYAKMRNNVQDCALACAQYAVLNCNAKPMNKLLTAMPDQPLQEKPEHLLHLLLSYRLQLP